MSSAAVHITVREFLNVTLFMAAILFSFISQIPSVMVTGAGICAIYAFSAHTGRRFGNNDLLLFILSCILFLPAFINYHHGLAPIFYFVSTLATYFAAMAVSSHPSILLLKAFTCIYWTAIFLIAWVLYTYWGYPEPFGMVIEGSSTNGIPTYLIVLQVSLSLATYLTYGRLPVFSTIFTFAVAFFGSGRGSVVVAALIVAATLFINLVVVRREDVKLRMIFWGLLLIVVIIGVTRGGELLELVTVHTKLSVGLMDENRLKIWDDYSGKIDAVTLFLGADYSGTIIEYEYGGNPHISYIRTHSMFGLPMTLLVMVSPVFVLFFRKPLVQKLVFFTFISLSALRAISEPIFFPALTDLFYFIWFFMCMKHVVPGYTCTSKSSHYFNSNV